MKKYIASMLLAVMILGAGTIGGDRVEAQEMSLQDFVKLLIALEVIPPEKANAARIAVGLPTEVYVVAPVDTVETPSDEPSDNATDGVGIPAPVVVGPVEEKVWYENRASNRLQELLRIGADISFTIYEEDDRGDNKDDTKYSLVTTMTQDVYIIENGNKIPKGKVSERTGWLGKHIKSAADSADEPYKSQIMEIYNNLPF